MVLKATAKAKTIMPQLNTQAVLLFNSPQLAIIKQIYLG